MRQEVFRAEGTAGYRSWDKSPPGMFESSKETRAGEGRVGPSGPMNGFGLFLRVIREPTERLEQRREVIG